MGKNEDLEKRVFYWQMKYDDMVREKDKEIEELKAKLLSKRCWEVVEDIERKSKEYFENPQEQNVMLCSQNDLSYIIRHQVCEEIREKIKNNLSVDKKFLDNDDYINYYAIINWYKLKYILDQIEQGESK